MVLSVRSYLKAGSDWRRSSFDILASLDAMIPSSASSSTSDFATSLVMGNCNELARLGFNVPQSMACREDIKTLKKSMLETWGRVIKKNLNGPPGLFFLFSLFLSFQFVVIIISQWLDLNHGSLVSKMTVLPTAPPPIAPYFFANYNYVMLE